MTPYVIQRRDFRGYTYTRVGRQVNGSRWTRWHGIAAATSLVDAIDTALAVRRQERGPFQTRVTLAGRVEWNDTIARYKGGPK